MSYSLLDVNLPSLHVEYSEQDSLEDIKKLKEDTLGKLRDSLRGQMRDSLRGQMSSMLDDMTVEILSIFHELCTIHVGGGSMTSHRALTPPLSIT